MISYTTGDLLKSEAQALVNTVNTEGVMGKGLALQFKSAFPENYKIYRNACKKGQFSVGQVLITEEIDIFGNRKLIINFPTKTTWRKPSEYEYIHQGLVALRQEIQNRGIKSIAIPPLGSRNGGLDWNRVRQMIETELVDLDCDIILYQPTEQILDRLEEEKVKLTPARAMLLDVLCDFSGEMTLKNAIAASQALSILDSPRVKINGIKAGQLYYKAYLPKESWRERNQRLTQPPEVRIHVQSGGSLKLSVTEITEDWSDADSLEPKLTASAKSFSSYDDAAAEIQKISKRSKTVFIYAREDMELKHIFSLVAKLNLLKLNIYVFTE